MSPHGTATLQAPAQLMTLWVSLKPWPYGGMESILFTEK